MIPEERADEFQYDYRTDPKSARLIAQAINRLVTLEQLPKLADGIAANFATMGVRLIQEDPRNEQLSADLQSLGWTRDVGNAALAEIHRGRAVADRLRAALERLCNAADDVGVRCFDTDTMEPDVEEMQAATMSARDLLEQKP